MQFVAQWTTLLICGAARRRWVLFALLLLLAGCSEIDTTYGDRANSSSVNGTSVLGDMFAEAGHRVASWPWLSPRLQQDADVIVWFPDDFRPPSVEARRWLENWLIARPGRTLIFVGRDYDAAPDYWRKARAGTQGERYAEFSRRLAETHADYKLQRGTLPANEDAEWFTIDGGAKPRSVRTLAGDKRWLEDIDPAKVEIELNSRLLPGSGAEILLESAGDALVTRSEWGDSQLLVITNGSLFLNLKLINHEHRKLAGHLIDAIGPAARRVYFLESPTREIGIYNEEPRRRSANPLNLVGVAPLNHILLQLAMLGLLFAWSRTPIFGIARQVEVSRMADFGQHVAALGELMEATRDRQYAVERLALYHQAVRHDAPRGRLHLTAREIMPTAMGAAPAAAIAAADDVPSATGATNQPTQPAAADPVSPPAKMV